MPRSCARRRRCATTRAASAASSGRRRVASTGSSRRGTPTTSELRGRRDQRRPVRVRRGVAAGADRRPAAVAGHGRALPHRARRAGPRRGPRRDRDRRRGRRPLTGHQRPGPARPGRMGPADRLNDGHMLAGVTMVDPSTVYLEPSVEIATDVTLEPGVILRGRTRIGRGDDDRRADRRSMDAVDRAATAVVWASVVERSRGRGRGPRRAVQPPAAGLGRRARTPRSATTPRSRTAGSGRGVKQHHMSYLGDADIGERDERRRRHDHRELRRHAKHQTTIGEGSSSASTRCSARRSTSAMGRGPAPGRSSPGTSRPASSRVGVPARIREPRPPRPPAPTPSEAR